jgi:hypothetical protein
MGRYNNPDEPNFRVPKEITFIDTVSLDEELQLIREEFWEEMAPIDAAWDNYEPGRTWGTLLPLGRYDPPKWVHLTGLQLQFLRHLVWSGEINMIEAEGLANRCEFHSALDLLGSMPMEQVLASANLTWQLQQDCEAAEAMQ